MNRLRSNPLPVARLHAAIHSELDTLRDVDLLDRFARYADHAAFEVLLRRHGPMVYGVCRRILADTDAEDAFQATFLVLIRKARAIYRGDRLGPWLYGVACRVAMKARSRRTRFPSSIAEAAEMIADPTTPAEIPDWLPILDAELAALPAKYRDALVLCELQGASRAEAARTLGLREGTLSSRLARGRELLRKRLLKHGTLLPVGGLAALFSAHSVGRATIPLTLFTQTAELAKVATGTVAGTVPVGAARLTDEVLKGMFLNKLRATVGAVLAAVLVAVGVTAAALPADAPRKPAEEKGNTKGVPSTSPAKSPAPEGAKRPDREVLQGLWTLDRFDLLSSDLGNEEKLVIEEMNKLIGKMQFLVIGDTWWNLDRRHNEGGVIPTIAKIDPVKNPKWLDLTELTPKQKPNPWIYELSEDRLKICAAAGADGGRVAEFRPSDGVPILVLEFRREKLPPAEGEKSLIGSWEGAEGERMTQGPGDEKPFHLPPARVEILDGYLFVTGPKGNWIGGKYTVDMTKNPKWIDVELVVPHENEKVTKLYGCYEVSEGRVKLALGTNGKRTFRPLELKTSDNVLYFDLKPATKPLAALLETADLNVPVPKPKPIDKPASKPTGKPIPKTP